MEMTFSLPTKIIFGRGSINRLADIALPYKKAVLVTKKGALFRLGYVDRLRKILRQKGIDTAVYGDIQENPTVENVGGAAGLCRAEGCDAVIGFGGGSAMDVAKCAAIMATNDGELWDYADGSTGKSGKIKTAPLPLICIPTTAGTGSEADPWAVITKKESHEKTGIGDPAIFPVLSIVDPDYTDTVPPLYTAYQGMDAFFHASEGYIAGTANDMSRLFSLKAIEYLAEYLPEAVNKNTPVSREKVCFASMLGGFVQSTTLCTSLHSYAQSLAAFNDRIPHGASLIFLCAEFFKMYGDVIPEKFIEMARVMGVPDARSPDAFHERLRSLISDCGVGDIKMSDYGIKQEELKIYVDNAEENGLSGGDPFHLSGEQALGMYRRSYR